MKKLFITILFILFFSKAYSQEYQTAGGIRAGLLFGASVKHFINQNEALEGLLATRWGGINLTGLYEYHKPLKTSKLYWYYGGGAHLAFYNGFYAQDNKSYTIVGIDGIIGLEHTFANSPINISIDYKPAIHFGTIFSLGPDEFAVSIRYVFK